MRCNRPHVLYVIRPTEGGMVARFAPQKGLPVLLQAAVKLLGQRRNLVFWLPVTGPSKIALWIRFGNWNWNNIFFLPVRSKI